MNNLLTLAMIVRNEEFFLPQCLESVKGIVDDMVIVDTGSTDRTVEIAESFGARVIHIPWPNDFAKARNVGLDAVKTPWVLVMDADEELVKEDLSILEKAIQMPQADAYNIRIVSVMDRAEDISESYVTRLFRSHPKVRYEGSVHEQIFNTLNAIGFKLAHIPMRLIHKGYLSSVVQGRNKAERNRKLLEEQVRDNPKNGYMSWQLAQTYYGEGRFAESIEASRKALRLFEVNNPLWVLAQVTYARALMAISQPKKALRVLAEGKLSHPQYTDFFYLDGMILMGQEKWEAARQAFLHCLELGEASAYLMTDTGVGGFKALYRIAQTYIQQQDGKNSMAYLLLCIKQQPHYRAAWDAIFDLLAGSTIQAVADTILFSLSAEQAVKTLEAWPHLTQNEQHVLTYLTETYLTGKVD